MITYTIDENSGAALVTSTAGYVGAIQGPVVITTSVQSQGSPVLQVFKGNRLALSFQKSQLLSVNGAPPEADLEDLVIQLSGVFNA